MCPDLVIFTPILSRFKPSVAGVLPRAWNKNLVSTGVSIRNLEQIDNKTIRVDYHSGGEDHSVETFIPSSMNFSFMQIEA